MKLFILCLFFCVSNMLFAQKKTFVKINFQPTFKHLPIQLKKQYYRLSANDSLLFETIKGYFTHFEFYENDKMVFAENESYHLVDAAVDSTKQIKIPVPENLIFNSIHFCLGVDSITSVSGAMGADLDPSNAMYWTWQSGYINFKLEGKSNLCATRKNEFQFHLGGFSGAANCLQNFYFPAENEHNLLIEIALDKFFETIDLSKQNDVAIPGKEAVGLAKKLRFSIRLKAQ